MRAKDTSPESGARATRAGNASSHIGVQLIAVVGCGAGSVLVHLRPDAFGRIEFGCARRKFIDTDARMAFQELLHCTASMDRMSIPQQHNRPSNVVQQVPQKGDHLRTTHAMPMRMHMQFDPPLTGTDAQRSQQIEALVMLGAGADGRRLSARCPGAFQRAEQGKATFVGKNQRSPNRLPLFLSAARRSAANERWLVHRGRTCDVAGVGNSSQVVATDTIHRLDDRSRQIVYESVVSHAPRSSNLRHSLPRTPHALGPATNTAGGTPISGSDAPTWLRAASVAVRPHASGEDCVWSCPAVALPAAGLRHAARVRARGADVAPTG
jgi:hypothetical protein